ncbi:MAG: Crp/Fnr family transcriptional regulator [Thermoleophilaceae bacterium]|nr:Crp/Fnr family transcriptional regulator [Thermoleophilaceae bacterium]
MSNANGNHDGAVCVLREDPDLCASVPADERSLLERASCARVGLLRPGNLEIGDELDSADSMGLLLLEGFIGGFVKVEGRCSLELLGAGDISQPWVRGHPNVTVRREVDWRVLAPTRVAILDADFMRRVAAWPQIAAALMHRAILRARGLTLLLAVNAVPRVDERVLLLLWHLADRWGRVTRDGVLLELPLTQEQLSMMIGAQRPSVTTALSQLRAEERIEPVSRGVWLLRSPAPGRLDELKVQTGLPRLALPEA